MKIVIAIFVATTLHVVFSKIPVISREEDTTRKTREYHPQKKISVYMFRFSEKKISVKYYFCSCSDSLRHILIMKTVSWDYYIENIRKTKET